MPTNIVQMILVNISKLKRFTIHNTLKTSEGSGKPILQVDSALLSQNNPLFVYNFTSTCTSIIYDPRHKKTCIFSSPEPKAHGELIVYQSSRRPSVRACVRPSVCASVHTFKHYYLHNQQAYSNQILSEASLGWGKVFIRFWTRLVRNSGFHGNRKPP